MTASPTRYQIAAAIQVAKFIDSAGNAHEDARSSYRTTATQKTFPPSTLTMGEGLLIAAGLLRLENGKLLPMPALSSLTATRDEDTIAATIERLIAERNRKVDRSNVGAAGEEFVLIELQGEFETLHRPDLATECTRVSLISDYFGYDITAPTLDGSSIRRLEVKTQTAEELLSSFRFYLTRNEYDVGRSNPTEWSMVACSRVTLGDEIRILGWCRAATLSPYLPVDQGGRWTEALALIPTSLLTPGLPPPL